MPFDYNTAKQNLSNLGFDDDSDEGKALASFARALQPPEQKLDWGKAIGAGLADGAVAGLARLGGASHEQAMSQANLGAHLADLNQKAIAQQQEVMQMLGKIGLERRLKQIDADRASKAKAEASRYIYGGEQPAPIAEPQKEILPWAKDEQQPAPQGVGPTSTPATPSPAQSMAPSIGAAPAATGVPGTSIDTGEIPPPTQSPPSQQPPPLPSNHQTGNLSRYQVENNPRIGLLRTQLQRAVAARAQGLVVDDKDIDNIRAELEQEIKLAEVQRAAAQNDPGLAADIETSKARAKADVEREQHIKSMGFTAKGVSDTLRDLYAMPDNDMYKDAFRSAIGPIENWKPDLPVLGETDVGGLIRTPHSWFSTITGGKGAQGASNIRSKISGDMSAMAANMKQFVRKPGEGSWTDADQAGLERSVGDLLNSTDVEDYKQRIIDVRTRMQKAFVGPYGITIPEIQDQKQDEAAHPSHEEVGTTRQLRDGRKVVKTPQGWQVAQ